MECAQPRSKAHVNLCTSMQNFAILSTIGNSLLKSLQRGLTPLLIITSLGEEDDYPLSINNFLDSLLHKILQSPCLYPFQIIWHSRLLLKSMKTSYKKTFHLILLDDEKMPRNWQQKRQS